jgi:hypothetical protein
MSHIRRLSDGGGYVTVEPTRTWNVAKLSWAGHKNNHCCVLCNWRCIFRFA